MLCIHPTLFVPTGNVQYILSKFTLIGVLSFDFVTVVARSPEQLLPVTVLTPPPKSSTPVSGMLYSRLAAFFLFPFIASALASDQTVMGETQTQTLSDFLTIEPSASIFYDYARGINLGSKLSDKSSMITVFVPKNKAIMKLAKKPHQDKVQTDGDVILTEEEMYARSQKNVERWIAAHIIPTYPIDFSSQSYPTLLDGTSIRFDIAKGDPDTPEWSNVLVNKEIRIVGFKEASNGAYYLVDGVIETN